MRFHNITTATIPLECYERYVHANSIERMRIEKHIGSDAKDEMLSFHQWANAGKPYYMVYPSIIPILTRIKLDIPCDIISPPIPQLLIRLPEQNNSLDPLKTIFISDMGDKIVVQCDYCDECVAGGFFYKSSETIEEISNEWDISDCGNGGIDRKNSETLKLICSLCLLGNDPTIITPDVLNADKDKWERADAEKRRQLENKAKHRHKYGYLIGAKIECIPHYRRPHFRLARVGKGRRDYRIVSVKSAIVHREVVQQIPHGYEYSNITERQV
jgi:hypothetical protein